MRTGNLCLIIPSIYKPSQENSSETRKDSIMNPVFTRNSSFLFFVYGLFPVSFEIAFYNCFSELNNENKLFELNDSNYQLHRLKNTGYDV